jgi:hypothetical protein
MDISKMGRAKCSSHIKVPIFRMEKRCSAFKGQKSKYKFPCSKDNNPVHKDITHAPKHDNEPLLVGSNLTAGQKKHFDTINSIEEREKKKMMSKGASYNADDDDDDIAFDIGKIRKVRHREVIKSRNNRSIKAARKSLASIKKWRIKHPPKHNKPNKPSLKTQMRDARSLNDRIRGTRY